MDILDQPVRIEVSPASERLIKDPLRRLRRNNRLTVGINLACEPIEDPAPVQEHRLRACLIKQLVQFAASGDFDDLETVLHDDYPRVPSARAHTRPAPVYHRRYRRIGFAASEPHAGLAHQIEDRPVLRLYAAGELVGGLFYHNYAGGSGLMAGAVFGRLAGQRAGRAVLSATARV